MDNVVGWIALYAAVVSTVVAVLKLIEIIRDRASVRVEATLGQIGFTGSDAGPLRLIIRAVNTGRRPVTLNSGGLWLSNGESLVSMGAPDPTLQSLWGIPKKLDEGDDTRIWFDVDELRERIDVGVFPKKAWFRDVTGHTHTTRISRLDF